VREGGRRHAGHAHFECNLSAANGLAWDGLAAQVGRNRGMISEMVHAAKAKTLVPTLPSISMPCPPAGRNTLTYTIGPR